MKASKPPASDVSAENAADQVPVTSLPPKTSGGSTMPGTKRKSTKDPDRKSTKASKRKSIEDSTSDTDAAYYENYFLSQKPDGPIFVPQLGETERDIVGDEVSGTKILNQVEQPEVDAMEPDVRPQHNSIPVFETASGLASEGLRVEKAASGGKDSGHVEKEDLGLDGEPPSFHGPGEEQSTGAEAGFDEGFPVFQGFEEQTSVGTDSGLEPPMFTDFNHEEFAGADAALGETQGVEEERRGEEFQLDQGFEHEQGGREGSSHSVEEEADSEEAEMAGEITTSPGEETTSPGEETKAPGEEIIAAGEETSASGEETTVPATHGDETIAPEEETTAPVEEIVAHGEEITAPVEEIKIPGEETTGPGEEVKAPNAEMKAPVEEIKAPVDEATVPGEEIVKPAEVVSERSEVKDTEKAKDILGELETIKPEQLKDLGLLIGEPTLMKDGGGEAGGEVGPGVVDDFNRGNSPVPSIGVEEVVHPAKAVAAAIVAAEEEQEEEEEDVDREDEQRQKKDEVVIEISEPPTDAEEEEGDDDDEEPELKLDEDEDEQEGKGDGAAGDPAPPKQKDLLSPGSAMPDQKKNKKRRRPEAVKSSASDASSESSFVRILPSIDDFSGIMGRRVSSFFMSDESFPFFGTDSSHKDPQPTVITVTSPPPPTQPPQPVPPPAPHPIPKSDEPPTTKPTVKQKSTVDSKAPVVSLSAGRLITVDGLLEQVMVLENTMIVSQPHDVE